MCVQRSGEAGFAFLKLIMIIAAVGGVLTVAGRIAPGVYDYYVLRDLADRVVVEYAKLPPNQVRQRVEFELDRSHIKWDEDVFFVAQTAGGYRVTVNYKIPLNFTIGGKEVVLKGYDELILTYEVGQ